MRTKLTAVASLFLVLILIIALSKHNTRTKKYLEYGQDLKESIEDFETNRKEFTDELKTVTVQTSEEFAEGGKHVSEIAENWDERWSDLTGRLNKLKKDFSDVGKSSGKYFTNLEELIAGIRDDGLRREEIRRNEEVHNQWSRAYRDAAQSLTKIEEVMYEGNDFYKVLVASSIRQQVRSDIKELESITLKALALLDELKEFSEEGKKLINQY